jgi:hypothetical protein
MTEQMTTEAPAEALPTAPEAESEDAALHAIWEKHQGEGTAAEPAEDDPAPVARDEAGRFQSTKPKEPVKPEPVKAETTEGQKPEQAEDGEKPQQATRPAIYHRLPKAVQAQWDTLPDDLRESVARSHDEMAKKSMEAGRLAAGLGPIRDALAGAIRELPGLQNMTPQQLAEGALKMARVESHLMTAPVDTILQIAQERGVLNDLRARLAGQGPQPQGQQQAGQIPPQIIQHIQRLEQQVKQLSSPDIIRGQVASTLAEQQAASSVQGWMGQRGLSEQAAQMIVPYVPHAMEAAGAGASHSDILDLAYQMATRDLGLSAAPQAAPAQPAQAQHPAPPREGALRAKSVNVTSRASEPRQPTEEESMLAAYRKAMNR